MKGLRACLAALAALLVLAPAARPSAPGRFLVGFADTLPEQNTAAGPAAAALGASVMRFTLQWTPGESGLSPAETIALRRGVVAAGSMRVVLSVYGTSSAAPLDDASRAQYCSFVSDALRRAPAISNVVIWNEPNKAQFWSPQDGASAAYEALLASCYDTLHASFPSLNVLGLALAHDGKDDSTSTSPGAFIRGVGDAYRASGRAGRIFDSVAFQPYALTSLERPWVKHVGASTISEGDWNKLMYNLWLGFNGTGQPIPGDGGVTIWYTELGFQSTVPADRSALYNGGETAAALPENAGGDTTLHPADDSNAPDQATQATDAISLAACQPYVAAVLNFLAVDEPSLAAWQSAPLYPDLTPKSSAGAFANAFAAASSGAVDCNSLKGGVPSSDFLPPTAPSRLAAAGDGSGHSVTLTWTAASDAQSKLTYRIFRNGTQVGAATKPAFTDTSVMAMRAYTYTVRAIDSAWNLGPESAALKVTPALAAPASPGGGSGNGRPAATNKTTAKQILRVLSGTRHGDHLVGTNGDDVLRGLGGNDVLDGRAGHDRLLGGAGNDVLRARDGLRDVVDCGPGRDIAYVDRKDVVARTCETVRR